MAKILITGATGFLGTRLAARLRSGHEVWALVRRKPPAAPDAPHWLIQDLSAEQWTVRLPERIDAVIHLAQSAEYRNFPSAAREIFDVSATSTMRLADWARRAGASHFIVASTGGLYGASETPVRESDALIEDHGPLGFYFASKRASELIVSQYSGVMTTAILRCFFIYGSHQSAQMLMPRLVASVREGRPVTLQGEDGIRINPIHVDDAARAVERCLSLKDSSLINVAGPEPASLRHIAGLIGTTLQKPPVFSVDERARPRHLVADVEKMRTVLGAPSITLAQGIRELCASEAREAAKA
jgi:nucleoside-diphosphate-sugar epimerase